MALTEGDIDTIERVVDERLDLKFPNLSARVDKILELLQGLAGNVKNLEDEQATQSQQLSRLQEIHPGGHH